ncbi:MAG TPA: YdiU family protein [Dermatophilaceae bacterium]|nr:YdiU family protein [Dermatophilaceae bacterium]
MISTPLVHFEDSYARAVPKLSLPWQAAPVPSPRLVVLNEDLAAQMGLDPDRLRESDGLALLTGRLPWSGASGSTGTFAHAYAGHQFGSWVPRLGDGRALLLGEVVDAQGRRRDLHLKGSGRTPFARGGDGLAVLGPMLREYIVGEAMHGLGIRTTRALAVVATGQDVLRGDAQPGAVLCRVAASHLRVGTFQYAAATGDPSVLTALADYALARHYPQAAEADRPYLSFFESVVAAQADLVARWMLVGFVHGVMNTDNMAISGETIDFGPCAFMDRYDPGTVFSSIDRQGRYAYGNQAAAAQWNLARLAEALLPLLDADQDAAVAAATKVLGSFATRYETALTAGMAAKLGLPVPDNAMSVEILDLLRSDGVDFTGFFRALSAGTARSLFADPGPYDAWAARRQARLGSDPEGVAAAMDRRNPVYVPRNHCVERVLARAAHGDLAPLERLIEAVRRPFEARPGLEDLAGPGPAQDPPYVTYCGT